MGIQNKIKRGQVSGGSGVKSGGVSMPSGRMPTTPSIGPKRDCNIMGERKGSGEKSKGKSY